MEIDFTPILVGWLGAAIAGGLGAYFGAYLSRKGENLATKEDIADITKLQEGVRHDFQSLTERMRAVESMRMAVAEERFEAHQAAYSLWLRLFRGLHDEDCKEQVLKCQEWWEKRGLYLDPEARKALRESYLAAFRHSRLEGAEFSNRNQDAIERNYDTILRAGSIIESAVNLPPLGELATQSLSDK